MARLLAVPVLLLAVVFAGAGPAWAHTDAPVVDARPALAPTSGLATTATAARPEPTLPIQVLRAVATPSATPWLALAAVTAFLGVLIRRFPRAIGIVVVLALAVLTYETGVHSVHHVSDPGAARSCAVASASVHVSGLSVDATSHDMLVLPPVSLIAPSSDFVFASTFLAAPDGRAPPLAA